jgi:hypothetical protein
MPTVDDVAGVITTTTNQPRHRCLQRTGMQCRTQRRAARGAGDSQRSDLCESHWCTGELGGAGMTLALPANVRAERGARRGLDLPILCWYNDVLPNPWIADVRWLARYLTSGLVPRRSRSSFVRSAPA